MNKTNLKNRLVGAIVIVSIGVIFIPLLMEGNGLKTGLIEDIVLTIPENDTGTIELLSAKKMQAEFNSKLITINKKITQTAVPNSVNKKQTKLLDLTAWAIQVATFTQEKRALSYRDKLRKSKFPAYVEKVSSRNKLFYKVRVGPLPNKKEADKTKAAIIQKFNEKPIIVSYP